MRNGYRLWRRWQVILVGPGLFRVIITTKGGAVFVGQGPTISEAETSAILETYQ